MPGPKMSALVGAVTLLLAGCATTYGPKNATGGYVEEWRSSTELEVAFHHNGYMTLEEARELAIRRAAELALEGGHRYFRVWGERLHRQKFSGPQYAVIQALLLAAPEEGAVDAIEVIRDTDALARGKLSTKARAQLRALTAP